MSDRNTEADESHMLPTVLLAGRRAVRGAKGQGIRKRTLRKATGLSCCKKQQYVGRVAEGKPWEITGRQSNGGYGVFFTI